MYPPAPLPLTFLPPSYPDTAMECPPLSHPNGYFICTEGRTVNSTCQIKCNQGFLMVTSPVTCDITGIWTGPRPVCTSNHSTHYHDYCSCCFCKETILKKMCFVFPDYKHALMAIAGCGACAAGCCICFCWMKNRKRECFS